MSIAWDFVVDSCQHLENSNDDPGLLNQMIPNACCNWLRSRPDDSRGIGTPEQAALYALNCVEVLVRVCQPAM